MLLRGSLGELHPQPGSGWSMCSALLATALTSAPGHLLETTLRNHKTHSPLTPSPLHLWDEGSDELLVLS